MLVAAPAGPLLELRGISKTFPGVKALSAVNFSLRAGEIHSLMGENGAGKSTLIKVLTGVYQPDGGGTISLDGKSIAPRTPQEAQNCGISTVYQEVNLIPHLSVAENITLGRQPKRLGLLSWGAAKRRAEEALARLDLKIDVTQSVASYSIAIQQLVAIARALDISAKVLILDEPTSSLDTNEVEQLFAIMRKLRGQGLGIIFVSHFINQVYAVSDRITILRNGQHVGEYEAAKLPRLELISRMIGRDAAELEKQAEHRPRKPDRAGKPLVSVKSMSRKGAINPFDLEIPEGNVVALAGLLGSGRTEVARLLFGIDQKDSGEMAIEGATTSLRSPRDAVRARFAFCSEDRKVEGIIPHLSVRENIILALQAKRGWLNALSETEQNELADRFIHLLRVSPPDPEKPITLLSGGNQQKVLLARWLASEPRLLILDEPTRGIDVGAKFEIEKLMGQLTEKGLSILFISSELEEVARASDRVYVLRDRRVIKCLTGAEISEASIMQTIAAANG